MTFTSGLFVRPDDDDNGASPVEARRALAGMFEQVGILTGLNVTGTGVWQYAVSSGVLASQRSTADGVMLFGNDASTNTPTVPGAPPSGSRIDIIYAFHNDVDNGNTDSLPQVLVASGLASGSPSPPAIPAGGVELARATVAADATNTSHENVTLSTANRPTALLRRAAKTSTTIVTTSHFTTNMLLRARGDEAYLSANITKDAAVSTVGAEVTIATNGTIPAALRPTEDKYALGFCFLAPGTEGHRVYPIRVSTGGGVFAYITTQSGSLPGNAVLRFELEWMVG